MSIPVIGTAIVNGPHWLKRLIDSVDYPVDEFVIFNNNGRGQFDEELDLMAKIEHQFIKKIKVCHLPKNIGCSGAWNMIIKCYMNAPYWIIVNHDVSFTEGFLEEMYTKASDPETGMVHGCVGDFGIGGYDLFLIKDWTVQKLGLFDENFYPAYCEDADYIMRFKHNPVKTDYCTKPYLHGGTTEYYETGSQTKKEDPSIANRLTEINVENFEYMTKKWGEGWRWVDPYRKPFNDENSETGRTTYDLEYVRKKNLGF